MIPTRVFGRNQAGNVALVFAIAVVPIMIAAGSAIDMIRANNARTILQGAADAAALAGGGSKDTSTKVLEDVASHYLVANGADDLDGIKLVKIQDNKATGKFSVRVSGEIKTSLMALAGIKTIEIDAVSVVKRGSSGPLEMVLALDTTYSMMENDKIGSLRTAAEDLVNKVMTTGNVKVGIAPFSDYFKVGTKYKDEAWVNVPETVTSSYESCQSISYPNRSGCSIQTTCYADGVPYTCNQENCSDWGTPVKSGCSMVTDVNSWDGCVAARPAAYHDSIADVGVPYPGVLWDCGSPLVALTADKSEVLDSIAGLYPSGNTNLPSGLIWAWNLLTPEAPLTEAASMSEVTAKGGKKVMVLMSDGVNTVSPYPDGNYGSHYDTGYGDGTYTDNLTATLCEKIKDEGTIVYTVLFDVTDPGIETLLRNCATDSAKSYVADDATELLAAFADIGASLTKLRLTE